MAKNANKKAAEAQKRELRQISLMLEKHLDATRGNGPKVKQLEALMRFPHARGTVIGSLGQRSEVDMGQLGR